jgi:hypothetical protein
MKIPKPTEPYLIALCIMLILVFVYYNSNNRPAITNITKLQYDTVNDHEETDLPDTTTTKEQDDTASYNNDVFNDSNILKLTAVSSDIGFKTGLASYPTLTWTDNTITTSTHKSSLDVRYPRFLANNLTERKVVDDLNKYVESLVEKRITDDDKDVADTNKHNAPIDYIYTDLAVRYRIIGAQNGIVSLEMVFTDFTDGGNGNHDEPFTINWDLKSDRLLKDSELFCSVNYDSVLTPLVRQVIIKNFSTDTHIVQPLDDSFISNINSGTDMTNPDNEEHFLLSQNGLILVFPPYQVSAGNSGIVRAFIPYSEIPNVLCLP